MFERNSFSNKDDYIYLKVEWSINIQVPCKCDLFWCSSYIYSGFLSYENILDFNFCYSDSVPFTNKMIEKEGMRIQFLFIWLPYVLNGR